MHGLSTTKSPPHASVSRRAFLAGAAAVSAVAVPFAAGANQSAELERLIAERRGCSERLAALDDENYALSQRADRPCRPAVSPSEVTSRYCGTSLAARRFSYLSEIDLVAESEAAKLWLGDEWRAATLADWQNLRALFLKRQRAWDEWHTRVGYRANEDLIDKIADRRGELDDAVAFFPCRSLRDVALKLEYLREAVDFDSEHWLLLPDFLKTIRDFAAGEA